MRMTVPDLMYAIAVKVEIPATLDVDQFCTFAPRQRRQAGRGKRLVDIPPRVVVENTSLRRIEVFPLPLVAGRRQVDVTFGPQRIRGGTIYIDAALVAGWTLPPYRIETPRQPSRFVSEQLLDPLY